MDGWKLRAPLVSGIVAAGAYSSLAYTLQTLLSNGVNVLQALKIAEDTCENAVIGQALPGQPLTRLPARSPVFALPNRLGEVGVTPALAAEIGNRSTLEPVLYGIEIDGHYAVLYSPYGLAGGWELSQNPYAFGYEDAGAMAIGENVLMYAITQ